MDGGRKLNMEHRAGRSTFGSLVWALLLTFEIACAHSAWADSSGGTAPGIPSTPPAKAAEAASSPAAPVAVATPVPPLTTPAMTGPLQMASPNEINIPKYVPF